MRENSTQGDKTYMEIKRIFIQGAGTMGNGIAQVSAQAGYDVAWPIVLSDG